MFLKVEENASVCIAEINKRIKNRPAAFIHFAFITTLEFE